MIIARLMFKRGSPFTPFKEISFAGHQCGHQWLMILFVCLVGWLNGRVFSPARYYLSYFGIFAFLVSVLLLYSQVFNTFYHASCSVHELYNTISY